MKLDVKLPAIIEAGDYHDFDEYLACLEQIIPGIKFREVGLNPDTRGYVAVFYVGRLTDPAVKEKIREAKKRTKDYRGEEAEH